MVYNIRKETKMNIFNTFVDKILIFEKEPQRIGLSQFKAKAEAPRIEQPSLKNKEEKLSDLMRRGAM